MMTTSAGMRNHNSIALLGEPLVELTSVSGQSYNMGIAGDVLNVAVVTARLWGNTYLVTGLGRDSNSESIVTFAQQHNVDTSRVFVDEVHKAGLYFIENDEQGERSFKYQRSNSAAKHFFARAESLSQALSSLDAMANVYFSGITLALMSSESLTFFLSWLERYRTNGGRVIFDNNYRPALWSSAQEYVHACEQVLPLTDVFLPSLDDVMLSLNIQDKAEAMAWIETQRVSEVVISDGVAPLTLIIEGESSQVDVTPAKQVVDTTGAGDGFNGGYLAARLAGISPLQAVQEGMNIAADVVGHKGAILSGEYWDNVNVERNAENDSVEIRV
jgi:2-dehydro-3-deoxygluconokinase